MAKNLVVLRHAKRANKETEEIAPEYIEFAKTIRKNIEKIIGPIGVVVPSKYERAQNTARVMGYDFTICAPGLSKSVENGEGVPWGKDFETIRQAYSQGGSTKELGDYHAGLYKWLVQNVKADNILAITHDTRQEAAVASLLDEGEPLFLKGGLDYLEGTLFKVNQDKLYSVDTLRRKYSGEMTQMLEGPR